MNPERVIASFLRIAAVDLEAANALARIHNRNAVYHCSQAAEKIIRAVLTSEGVHAGIGHQLEQMIDKIPDENPIKEKLRTIEGLSNYATSFRYPTTVGRIKAPPSERELQDFWSATSELLIDVASKFAVDLSLDDGEAGNSEPIR
jgi:HEPN domain-containing protein